MKASVVDLRYKMNDILKALDRNEKITILYHGKKKGEIIPVIKTNNLKVSQHPFFGINSDNKDSVKSQMDKLRNRRHNDI